MSKSKFVLLQLTVWRLFVPILEAQQERPLMQSIKGRRLIENKTTRGDNRNEIF